jgi:D-alanine-D-alanine ligase
MQSLLPGRKLAFIYNVRHAYPDPNNPLTFNEADFDDENTIEYFIKHLKSIGFDLLPVESDLKAEDILRREKENIGFALNYSEEVLGSNPKIYMAEVLEKLGIPFSGCSNVIQRLIIDKGKMKQFLLKNKVSTLPYQVITSVGQKLSEKLPYPVIVKPIARGSSAGITNKSVVKDEEGLTRQVKFVLETFSEAALIEPYIEGREFSVAMVGNPPQVLPIIEPRHDLLPKDYFHIDSLEVKWELEEELGEGYLTCPAGLEPGLKSEVEKLCLLTWDVLGIKDFCRIDIRMNEKDNQLYVLDVNSPPGLIPPEITATSYLPLAAKAAGIDYEHLLVKIIEEGLKRY